MSFSSDIKKELCQTRDMGQSEMRAMLYGMFWAGRTEDGRRVIQTENPDLAAAARELSEAVFAGARSETKRLVRSTGSLYTFLIRDEERVPAAFGDFSQINTAVVSGSDLDSGAFLRGVFVSCGSVTDPRKEYHLELVLPQRERAEELCRFICEHGITVKTAVRSRRHSHVVYIKESEIIEDFLTYIGAGLHSLEIMQIKVEKSVRNRVNRTVNCETANLFKTVDAADRVCDDIELIFSELGADSLRPELRRTAMLRLANRDASLSELCGISGEPLSRSGLNHRLKKLSAIAEQLRAGTYKAPEKQRPNS